MSADDICRLAMNLARNCGYRVFPCGDDKRPTLKRWPDRAASDPDAIARLWRDHPGALIAVVAGELFGISVLDVDPHHPEAALWWQSHHHRLLPTRTYGTRSGGLHLFFEHRLGIFNTQGKLCRGVDTRGEGGYVIFWFAAGFGCFDHTPPAPWPDWLFTELKRPPPQPRPTAAHRSHAAPDNAEAILRRVATATEGERNGVLYWAANRLRERGTLKADETALLAAARAAGLPDIEARRTIASAGGRSS